MGHNLPKFLNDFPDVIILCGGLGTRLRTVVPYSPKSLAEIGDKVFLDIILQTIFDQGFTRVILAVGYMKEKIIKRYSGDSRILFSIEELPLGTGGAVKNAMGLIWSEHFIVMNGDSYCEVDLKSIYKKHRDKKPIVSMVLAKMDDISDFGSVLVDGDNRICAFKQVGLKKQKGLVSAGIYVFDKKIKNYMPQRENFSLEYDLFPLITQEFFHGHIVSGDMLDIGTPKRYNVAKQKFNKKHS